MVETRNGREQVSSGGATEGEPPTSLPLVCGAGVVLSHLSRASALPRETADATPAAPHVPFTARATCQIRFFFIFFHTSVPGLFSIVTCFNANVELQTIRREAKDGMFKPMLYSLTGEERAWSRPFIPQQLLVAAV
jgi:hypothetical protein